MSEMYREAEVFHSNEGTSGFEPDSDRLWVVPVVTDTEYRIVVTAPDGECHSWIRHSLVEAEQHVESLLSDQQRGQYAGAMMSIETRVVTEWKAIPNEEQ